jgi:hypothetical protein
MDLGIRLRTMITSVASLGVLLAVLGLSGAAASAAPSPSASPDVKTAHITVDGVDKTVTVTSKEDLSGYEALAGEVEWLRTRPGVIKAPDAAKLGVKVTLTLSVNGTAQQLYDLYPLAAGGPRAFRPAEQPDKRKVAAAWFYGRLSMPATLRAVGVPLGVAGEQEINAGGGGGGITQSQAPTTDIRALVGDWRRFMGLNSAVVVVIALGVFLIAFLVRRRT